MGNGCSTVGLSSYRNKIIVQKILMLIKLCLRFCLIFLECDLYFETERNDPVARIK
jgi:hypothetical protein